MSTVKPVAAKERPPAATAPGTALAESVRERLDAQIADLRTGTRTWATLTLGQRARLLESVRATVAATAQDWAETAALSKGMGPAHPLRGEEWLSGPYAILTALDASIASLTRLAAGGSTVDALTPGTAPGGRVTFPVFPRVPIDSLLLSGFSGEVWLTPGVSAADARTRAGLGQLDPTTPGGVGLVLGAGNVTSIPVLDALYELLAFNRVPIVKLNPTMDALLPVFERALAPLIEPGLVRFATGAGDVGAYLTGHPGIDHVHITGSAATFDAIVWGTGATAARRRREGRPALKTPITAELGGVSPIIVVPGEWSQADLRFQAEHIATMRLYNSGHNCIAGQVVILSSDWAQRDEFVSALRDAYMRAPERPVWYPRGPERVAAAGAEFPIAETYADGARVFVPFDEGQDASALETTEYFAPVLGVVALPGSGQEFLDGAVAHANEKLAGTLGANVLIDPATQAALGGGFEQAIADLRYGSIAINTWTGAGFLIPTLSWGGYPGGTLDDVGSGIGVVHNAFLLDDVERSVLRGPFRPFPRSFPLMLRSLSLSKGTLLPKPPWFVNARTGAAVSEGLTRFLADGSYPGLAVTFTKAFGA